MRQAVSQLYLVMTSRKWAASQPFGLRLSHQWPASQPPNGLHLCHQMGCVPATGWAASQPTNRLHLSHRLGYTPATKWATVVLELCVKMFLYTQQCTKIKHSKYLLQYEITTLEI